MRCLLPVALPGILTACGDHGPACLRGVSLGGSWPRSSKHVYPATRLRPRPVDALVGIVVGERFPDWERPAAIEAGRKVGIEPLIMDWTMGRPVSTTLKENP